MEPTSTPERPRRSRLTEDDVMLLTFVAEHRIVVAAHAAALLGVKPRTAQQRLRALRGLGTVDSQAVWHGRPACYWITRRGLGLVNKRYAMRPIDPRGYDHDIGVAWLWLAARAGHWGPMGAIVSERQMRSSDYAALRGLAPTGDDPLPTPAGVRLGGVGPTGQPRLHYPDLLLVTPAGQRIALELEFTPKGTSRLERILTGYAIDRRIAAILYLTDDPAVARGVRAAARRLGLRSLVHVQRVRMERSPAGGAAARAAARVRRGDAAGPRAPDGCPAAEAAGGRGAEANGRLSSRPEAGL